ncbi:MAG: hypothetical protein HOI47_25185 [Candidatus Scalindua sp.]|jgi:hypothetical protein|nr:hypothetical protein [Gammaproteobacteria bacterium]MBT6229950.1 hypothetical protein [Candidatus Scalindua sp.]
MKAKYFLPIIVLILAGSGCSQLENDGEINWVDDSRELRDENQASFDEYMKQMQTLCKSPINAISAIEFRQCEILDLDEFFFDIFGSLPVAKEYEYLPAFCERPIAEMSAFEFIDCLADEPEIYE